MSNYSFNSCAVSLNHAAVQSCWTFVSIYSTYMFPVLIFFSGTLTPFNKHEELFRHVLEVISIWSMFSSWYIIQCKKPILDGNWDCESKCSEVCNSAQLVLLKSNPTCPLQPFVTCVCSGFDSVQWRIYVHIQEMSWRAASLQNTDL